MFSPKLPAATVRDWNNLPPDIDHSNKVALPTRPSTSQNTLNKISNWSLFKLIISDQALKSLKRIVA